MESCRFSALVDEQLCSTKRQRLNAHIEIFFKSRSERLLIDQQELASAISSCVLLDARIAIVEQRQIGSAKFKLHVVLMRKPRIGVPAVSDDSEVAVFAQAPQDVSRAAAIVVIDFQHPVLMTQGKENTTVCRQICRVAVQPVVSDRIGR